MLNVKDVVAKTFVYYPQEKFVQKVMEEHWLQKKHLKII